MKKGLFALAFLLIISISLVFVSAADNSTTTTSSDDMVSKGYTCLENSVKNSTTTLQNAIFASLAIGSRNYIDKSIADQKKSNEYCWPKSACTLKETAQVALVYYREGKSTTDVTNWLLSKNASMSDLTWYLEIDATNHLNSSCSIKYDSSTRYINIKDDMKLEGDSTSCYDISDNGYWLRINPTCYSKKFDISCTDDFVTTLLYTKSSADTIFVSSETHSQASNGTTSEEIKAKCFKTSGVCDYEGSLWTVFALSKAGIDVSAYLPYLIALADDNTRLFPSTFLYMLGVGQDPFSDIVNSQKNSKYWEISGSPGGRYYDTSLAMMALSGNPTSQLDNAKNYLLSIQDKNTGCWNNGNIRDTAFILYSGWPKEVSGSSDSGTTAAASCASAGKTCTKASDCTAAGGSIMSDYQCSSFGEFCCSVAVQAQTCSQKQGTICTSSQVCDGRSIAASDGSCCLDNCKAKPAEDTCTAGDGVCRDSCDSNEQEVDAVCPTSGNICCKAQTAPVASTSHTWLWIFLLIILIIAIVAAIVYRDRLKIEFLKFKGRTQSSPVRRTPPSPPGIPMGQRPMPGPAMFNRPGVPVGRPMPHPVVRPAPGVAPKPQPATSNPDKDMEETLRKLKEMSK